MFLLIFLMNLRCADGLPADCSYDCGRVYTGFLRDCGDTVGAAVALEQPDDAEAMAPYTAFNEVCADQDPLSLVRAIDAAECWTCGDGELNADKGEQCEPPNMEAGCTEECQLVVCPALPFDVEGGTVDISNNGTYPSTATYVCEGGDPPSDGDAERTCQTDGTWDGTAPTVCAAACAGADTPSGGCAFAAWDDTSTNPRGHTYTLYLLPDVDGWVSNADGAQRYHDLCAEYGLHTVVGATSNYGMPEQCSQYGCIQTHSSKVETVNEHTWGLPGPSWSSYSLVMTNIGSVGTTWTQSQWLQATGYTSNANRIPTSEKFHPVCGIEH
jgi:hypothetical protein